MRRKRALGNLVGNALRDAARGETVTLRTVGNPPPVRIEVEKRGAAIAPEHLAHRFDRSLRVDPTHHRAGDGAGPGLAINEAIAEAHGDSVSVGHNRLWRRIALA